jgi:hypothetical protein
MKGFRDFIECGPYPAYCKHLQEVCKRRKLVMEKIGSAGTHPLYCIRVNNRRKHAICVSAGIHGDETAGPWAVLNVLKEVDLRGRDHDYIFFPVANPSGFDMCKRRNHLNRDLNRHFREKELTGENKTLYDAIKDENLCLFYSLHEHPGAKGFYVYVSCDIDPGVSAKMMSLGRKHGFNIRKHHFGTRIPKGEVRLYKLEGDRSFEDKMFEQGIPYIVTETPDNVPLVRRVRLQYDLLKTTIENYEAEELH